METKNAILRGDYWVQTVLGGLMVLCFVTVVGIFFGLVLAIPFGGWQVISGLVLGIAYKDKRRLLYLAGVVLYFALWLISDRLTSAGSVSFPTALFVGGAALLGIAYYIITYKDYKNIDIVASKEDDPIYENILDS